MTHNFRSLLSPFENCSQLIPLCFSSHSLPQSRQNWAAQSFSGHLNTCNSAGVFSISTAQLHLRQRSTLFSAAWTMLASAALSCNCLTKLGERKAFISSVKHLINSFFPTECDRIRAAGHHTFQAQTALRQRHFLSGRLCMLFKTFTAKVVRSIRSIF